MTGCPSLCALVLGLVALILLPGPAALAQADYDTRKLSLVNPTLERVLRQLRSGNSRLASRYARRLARSRDEGERLHGAVLSARVFLVRGNHDQAREAIRPALSRLEAIQKRWPEVALEIAWYHMANHDHMEAMRIFNRVGEAHGGFSRVSAAEGMSDAFMRMSRFKESAEWMSRAVKLFKDVIEEAPHRFDVALKLLQAKLAEVRAIERIMAYGLGYTLYEPAHRAELGGRYQEAAKRYAKLVEKAEKNRENTGLLKKLEAARSFDPKRLGELPIASVYAEAARFYRMRSLVNLGRGARVLRDLREFVEVNRLGPYRGEALELIGDIHLEWKFRHRKAAEAYTEAMAWYRTIEAKDQEVEKFRVPSKAYGVTSPPDRRRKLRGNFIPSPAWTHPEPGDIVNRHRAWWYLDHRRMMAGVKRSLCRFLDRDVDGALGDVKIILELDPHDRELFETGMLSNYQRLRDGYRSGGLHATDEELALFSGRLRTAVLVADLHFEMERNRAAIKRYRRLPDHWRGLDAGQRAYLTYAMARAYTLDRQFEWGEALLDPFFERGHPFTRTPSWPRAAILKADYESKQEDRLAVYELIVGQYGDEFWGRKAMQRAAMNLYAWRRYKDLAPMLDHLEQAAQKYNDDFRLTVVRKLRKRMEIELQEMEP